HRLVGGRRAQPGRGGLVRPLWAAQPAAGACLSTRSIYCLCSPRWYAPASGDLAALGPGPELGHDLAVELGRHHLHGRVASVCGLHALELGDRSARCGGGHQASFPLSSVRLAMAAATKITTKVTTSVSAWPTAAAPMRVRIAL